jgi:HEAT repeat protein
VAEAAQAGVRISPEAVDPSDAKLIPPAEFRAQDVNARRRIIRAWAAGNPEEVVSEIIPLLRSALADPDSQVKAAAANTVLKIELALNLERGTTKSADRTVLPDTTSLLSMLFDDPDATVRVAAIRAVAAAGPPTKELEDRLRPSLTSDPSPLVRTTVIQAVMSGRIHLRSESAVTAVLASLAAESTQVRIAAINAVGLNCIPGGVERLLPGLEAAYAPVRLATLHALELYGLAPEVEAARARLASLAILEQDPTVRAAMFKILARIPAG